MILAALLAAGTLAPGITQQRVLAREFVCPADLADDRARVAAMQRFMQRYATFAPASTIPQRLAFHARLERAKRCTPLANELQYTVPQD